MKQQILNMIHIMIMNIITEIKSVGLLEKIVLIILFFIPIPFTLEGYLALRTLIKKLHKGNFLRSKQA